MYCHDSETKKLQDLMMKYFLETNDLIGPQRRSETIGNHCIKWIKWLHLENCVDFNNSYWRVMMALYFIIVAEKKARGEPFNLVLKPSEQERKDMIFIGVHFCGRNRQFFGEN